MSVEDLLYPLLSGYERLPSGVKHGVGSVYRRLPERVRLGARYEGFRRLAEEVEEWTAEQIAGYQLAELRCVVAHAARYSPFYARRFAEAGFSPDRLDSLEDFSACPEIDTTELAVHGQDMATSNPGRRQRLYMSTSGSTGTPVSFYLQKGVSRPKEKAFLDAQWGRAGYQKHHRLAVIRGTVISGRSDGPIASYDATRDWLLLSSYHLSQARLPEYLDQLRRFSPDILHAYPSAALQLAEFVQRSGRPWSIPLRCVLAGSERLTGPQQHLLEEVFGCRVYTWYGHSERAVLAGEGRTSTLKYFWPTYGYVEFGPPDTSGLREVIATSFHNQVMPLIRYHTGDWVRPASALTDGPLEYPWPAVAAIEGRSQEYLVTATGRRIAVTSMMTHDASFEGIYSLQFYQEQPGRAELRYVAGRSVDAEQLRRVRAVMARKLGGDFELELRRVEQIEKTARGKGRWLISNLDTTGSEREERSSLPS